MRENNLRAGFVSTMIIAVAALLVGSGLFYTASSQYGQRRLFNRSLFDLENGNYAAALAGFGKLVDKKVANVDAAERALEARKMLVAEEDFFRARRAAEEERWNDARVLLSGSAATESTKFKYYKEAKKLLEESEEVASLSEKELAGRLASLKAEANSEKIKRQRSESDRQKAEKFRLEQELKAKSDLAVLLQEKIVGESALANAKNELENTKGQIEKVQSQFELEQRKAIELSRIADKEQNDRIRNEIAIYYGIIEKGVSQLNLSLEEIAQGRDITALLFISQSRVLFDEAKIKSGSMSLGSNQENFRTALNSLVGSAAGFLDAANFLKNAVVYIDDKNSEPFKDNFNKASIARDEAGRMLGLVASFLK